MNCGLLVRLPSSLSFKSVLSVGKWNERRRRGESGWQKVPLPDSNPQIPRDALMTPSVLNPGLLVPAWEANRWWRPAGDVFTFSVGAARRAAWAQLQNCKNVESKWRVLCALCTAGGWRHQRKHLYICALRYLNTNKHKPLFNRWHAGELAQLALLLQHVWQKPLPALKNPNRHKNSELDVSRWVDPG